VQLSKDDRRAYDIQLLFAETADAAPGDRVFDVKIQDETVLSQFDIAADAGGRNVARTHEFNAITVRGTIHIELVPVKGKPPRLCALVINEAHESQ
jgi:hypothetical protein